MTDSEDITDAFAVVGTDTGVGKTVITAGIVGWLREIGLGARAVKPVQTGFPSDDDAAFIADVCGTDKASTCVRRFEPALAPAVAADVVEDPLDYDVLYNKVLARLSEADPGILEGIGGLRVPLADGCDVLDLVADLGVPVLVVARAGLGTLNHSALSVSALCRRDIDVMGVVLNQYGGESLVEQTNPDVLMGMVDCPVYTVPPLTVKEPSDVIGGVRSHLENKIFSR